MHISFTKCDIIIILSTLYRIFSLLYYRARFLSVELPCHSLQFTYRFLDTVTSVWFSKQCIDREVVINYEIIVILHLVNDCNRKINFKKD
jgi:hypothetical protein